MYIEARIFAFLGFLLSKLTGNATLSLSFGVIFGVTFSALDIKGGLPSERVLMCLCR